MFTGGESKSMEYLRSTLLYEERDEFTVVDSGKEGSAIREHGVKLGEDGETGNSGVGMRVIIDIS